MTLAGTAVGPALASGTDSDGGRALRDAPGHGQPASGRRTSLWSPGVPWTSPSPTAVRSPASVPTAGHAYSRPCRSPQQAPLPPRCRLRSLAESPVPTTGRCTSCTPRAASNLTVALCPGGTPRRIAALPAAGLPNGLARDETKGLLYAADSVLGTVWRIPLTGGTPTVGHGTQLASRGVPRRQRESRSTTVQSGYPTGQGHRAAHPDRPLRWRRPRSRRGPPVSSTSTTSAFAGRGDALLRRDQRGRRGGDGGAER